MFIFITSTKLQGRSRIASPSHLRYYTHVYSEFFLTCDANTNKNSTVTGTSGYMLEYHLFGWLLFVALRVHVFSRFKDLVTCTNGLVSILKILIIHIPVHLKNFSIHDSTKFGLMDESFPSSLNILEKDYDDAFWNKGELDKRVFINEDNLLGSRSLSGSSINTSGIKGKFKSIASSMKIVTSPLSPCRFPASHANRVSGGASKIAATPVSTAMTTAKWLRTVVAPLPTKPSPELEHFLASCDRNLTNEVRRRANIILEAIFSSIALGDLGVKGSLQSTNHMDDIWAEQ